MNSKKRIRLGLVGCGNGPSEKRYGRGGGLFVAAARDFDTVDAVAVCDLDASRCEHVKKECPPVECYTDYKVMFDEMKLDAVIIGTPATHHAEFAVAALEHDIHVLSEIPIAYDLGEADRLVKAEGESRATFMTGSNPNFAGRLKDMQRVKELGLLGEPNYMEVDYMHDLRALYERTPWRRDYECIRYCTHGLGPLLTLFDEDLESVSCMDTGSWINPENPNCHDVMVALFRTNRSRVVKLAISFCNNFKRRDSHRCVVHGTKGVYTWDEPDRTFFNTTEIPGARIPVQLHSSRQDPYASPKALTAGHGGMDYYMLEAFLNSIEDGTGSPLSLREGLRMTLPGVYAAESAANNGALTRINYPWNHE